MGCLAGCRLQQLTCSVLCSQGKSPPRVEGLHIAITADGVVTVTWEEIDAPFIMHGLVIATFNTIKAAPGTCYLGMRGNLTVSHLV